MSNTVTQVAFSGDVLSFQSCPQSTGGKKEHTYLIGVKDEAVSRVLEGMMPLLGRLLLEKTASVRERRLEEMVGFMAAQMLAPSAVDTQMAQRLAARHAAVLNEFDYFSAEQLADANRSIAASRSTLADNWRKRRQVFAVPHPDKSARERDVYPAFQFADHKPIKAVQSVLAAFGERKAPWKLALWFTSNNGWLPGSARPVDMLLSDPEAVIGAARHDAAGSAA
ncbi:MAG: hypothetical protein ABIG35_02640 [Pseudomonadota bacterium]